MRRSEPGVPGPQVCDQAHAAVSLAAAEGRGEPVSFDARIVKGARDRIEMMAALRDALDADEINIVFQPIIELSSGARAGYEALARWDWNGMAVSPAEFIPLAEQAGLTFDIFGLGIRRAGELAKKLGPAPEPFYISVNLSACESGAGGPGAERRQSSGAVGIAACLAASGDH